MIRFYTALLVFSFTIVGLKAQTFQLYTEDFNGLTAPFILNSTGPGGAVGTNKWIINDSYEGGFGYPNTTTQDLTEFGTIGGAPMSKYLHIYDEEAAPAITCASYNTTAPSDNFAEMSKKLRRPER